jgi:ABC-type sugar transport system ATPase subunit
MTETSMIKIEHIYKSFGSIRALQDISIELGKGEILGLVGDNAAGKSTLMNILFGVYAQDKGDILLEGKKVDIRSPSKARRLGIEKIHQNLALAPDLNVAENIFLGRELARFRLITPKTMTRKSKEALEGIGIDLGNLKRKVKYFSGGQRQAIAIAKAILFEPKVILMDEPTASISVKYIQNLHE